jgi:hypothetical protein
MSIKVNKSDKRRGSEIYFVLYLSALILLLPGKQEKKSSDAVDAITALFQQSFSLLPEKNSLLSKITTDSTGASILQLDTSNVLLLTGNVSDISFECIVEDQNNDEVIQVASKEGEHFSIVYDSTKKLVFFSWHPPISMLSSLNKSLSYVVTVKAKAKPFISGKNPELQQLLRSTDATLQTEARFSISILTEGQGEAPPKIVYMPAETTFTRMIFHKSNSKLRRRLRMQMGKRLVCRSWNKNLPCNLEKPKWKLWHFKNGKTRFLYKVFIPQMIMQKSQL